MNTITDKTFEVERALYGIKDTYLQNCKFEGELDGESPLKEVLRVTVENCTFNLRYPLWHAKNTLVDGCDFLQNSRAPIWYCSGLEIGNSKFHTVKAVRECENVQIVNSEINSQEFGWNNRFLRIRDCNISSEYAFLNAFCLALDGINFTGKYSFQYAKNSNIRNSVIDTKDAFWHAKNVTVVDSVIKGEYLGWYSENLTFINCKIIGTQPLCYCQNLKLIDCTLEGCDLAFEHSTVDAKINGHILSVKNPIGRISANSIGEIIVDKFSRGKCEITENKK